MCVTTLFNVTDRQTDINVVLPPLALSASRAKSPTTEQGSNFEASYALEISSVKVRDR